MSDGTILDGLGGGVIELSNVLNLPSGSEDRTYALWVKYDSASSTGGTLVGHGTIDSGTFYRRSAFLLVNDANFSSDPVLLLDFQVGFVRTDGQAQLGDNEWHHVAATFSKQDSDTGVKIFIDGEEVAVQAGDNGFNKNSVNTINTASDNLTFGYEYGWTNGNTDISKSVSRFLGSFDDAYIWNRKLSDQEILSLFVEPSSAASMNPLTSQYIGDGFHGVSSSISPPICFLKGTEILSQRGLVPVESLTTEDSVVTIQGKFRPIRRIGTQVIHRKFAEINNYLPVQVPAHFCSRGYPSTDLYVSPSHALFIFGHLIEARALLGINNVKHVFVKSKNVEYYHVELESHELIFANGMWCETFVNNISRDRLSSISLTSNRSVFFENIVEMNLPRIRFKRQIPAEILRYFSRKKYSIFPPSAAIEGEFRGEWTNRPG